jgi:ribonuclease E
MPDTEEQRIEEAKQAADAADATANDLDERSDRLGEQIEDSKRTHEQALADEKVPTASDWEDSEPEDSADDDPSGAGFDDPENLDLDDEDLDDDDAYPDDDEDDN